MFAYRGGTLASRARWGVLTWVGGGGEVAEEVVAGGNEDTSVGVQDFDGLEDDALLSDIGGVIPLFLLLANLFGEFVNLSLQPGNPLCYRRRVHLRLCCRSVGVALSVLLSGGELFREKFRKRRRKSIRRET